MGTLLVARGLSCPAACGILVPLPGIKLTSPEMQDGFLTTGPPGKFWLKLYLIILELCILFCHIWMKFFSLLKLPLLCVLKVLKIIYFLWSLLVCPLIIFQIWRKYNTYFIFCAFWFHPSIYTVCQKHLVISDFWGLISFNIP